jgi:hypothetical protein
LLLPPYARGDSRFRILIRRQLREFGKEIGGGRPLSGACAPLGARFARKDLFCEVLRRVGAGIGGRPRRGEIRQTIAAFAAELHPRRVLEAAPLTDDRHRRATFAAELDPGCVLEAAARARSRRELLRHALGMPARAHLGEEAMRFAELSPAVDIVCPRARRAQRTLRGERARSRERRSL